MLMVFTGNLASTLIRLLSYMETQILSNAPNVKESICVIIESEMPSKFMITKQGVNVMILFVKEISMTQLSILMR
jgi:hypothetical protein